MIEKFGKSFKDILDLKSSFFNDNDELLAKTLEYADLYTKQLKRTHCKVCNHKLPDEFSFVKHTIPYVFCYNCNHLNGVYEDSNEFCEAVYASNSGKEYAKVYSSTDRENYYLRRDNIYLPKVDFLLDVIAHEGLDTHSLSYADIGAGGGFLISAFLERGIKNVQGFEVNQSLVELGKWIDADLPLEKINLGDTVKICEENHAQVLTFIGVFEHLQDLRGTLHAIKCNSQVKYIYFCVPLYSPCVFSEMSFPEILPRHLAIGHTHLFTDISIKYFEHEFGFQRIGAWWFGTDMMDYYRSVMIQLGKSAETERMISSWHEMFGDLVDDMQLAIDKQRKSSQVHMVMKVLR